MGEHSTIEWCDGTWNPHRGCHKVSAGCDNCYMFAGQKRFGNDPSVVVRAAKETFDSPLKWKEPMRIFTCSWSDFFIKEADEWRDEAWDIIRDTPHHTYLILTKRPELIVSRLPDDWCEEKYGHVWLGVTAENQEQADKRISILLLLKSLHPWLKIFVSIEPMLGKIDLKQALCCNMAERQRKNKSSLVQEMAIKLDWVILGGESGRNARPMHPDWIRSIRDQCADAGVPFFFKQWGEWGSTAYDLSTGEPIFRQFENYQQWVNKARTWIGGGTCIDMTGKILDIGKDFMEAVYPVAIVRRVGKKKAGAMLDGEEYREVPA